MESDAEFDSLAPAVLSGLQELERALADAEAHQAQAIAAVPPPARGAARNLVHYVGLRQVDIRPLQDQLTRLGLSSLGRAEGAVQDALRRTTNTLLRALGRPAGPHGAETAEQARAELLTRTRGLLGTDELPAVMVTMPSEAAHDPEVTRGLLAAGMNVMRVNCAHDAEPGWRAMVAHLRRAQTELGRPCKVLFDLPGPKLRTLDIEEGQHILRVRPERDEAGRVLRPGRLRLRGADPGALEGDEPSDDEVWMAPAWVDPLMPGDTVELIDLRGRRRRMCVTRRVERGAECETDRTVYLGPGTQLTSVSRNGLRVSAQPLRIRARALALVLAPGDQLVLKADGSLGRPAKDREDGSVAEPAQIACGVPEAIAQLRVGQPVLFDDGKIAARVERVDGQAALLRVTRTRSGGAKLRAGKGINLPETALDLPSLSEADRAALDVAATQADIIGLSFARSEADVAALQAALTERALPDVGIILKIETRAGFEALPTMLLRALQRPNVGVMIARGDLAVELGFERLAEVQEQMLWLCEAARVPAIWATQVLETLAQKGQPTRAEITDAAMSERAECVMLNKGPYVREAVSSLRDVLDRMRGHQDKKRSMLRPLRSVRLPAEREPNPRG